MFDALLASLPLFLTAQTVLLVALGVPSGSWWGRCRGSAR